MFIAFELNSEVYSEFSYQFSENSKEKLIDWFKEMGEYEDGEVAESDYYDSYSKNTIVNRYDVEIDDFFDVLEIHEVKKAKYYLVNWHAYDGVGFSVKGFDSLDEAHKTMETEFNEMWDWIDDVEEINGDKEDHIHSTHASVDDDNEYIGWEIIERK